MSILNFFKPNNEQHFIKTVRPHLERLYRQAYRLTQNQDDAEDLVQELLLRLYEKEVDLSEIENPAAWLLRSLYNQFINNYRKKSRLPIDSKDAKSDEIIEQLSTENDSPHQHITNNNSAETLQQLITLLPPNQQALISLHDVEGHSLPELSIVMDMPIGTLKSRLHRARQFLREEITKNKPELMEPFIKNKRFSQ